MNRNVHWTRIAYVAGVIALLAGALEPMEGAIIVAGGNILLAVAAVFTRDRYKTVFIATAAMTTFGAFALFYASSLGGFEPKKEWWWLSLILPYPLGWLISITTLVIKLFTKPKRATILK